MQKLSEKMQAKAIDLSYNHSLLKSQMDNLIKETIGFDLWFQQQVQLGINSAHAGDVVSSSDIDVEADKWCSEIHPKINR
ncbi:hypothetical protein [Bartonella sp. ML70XJBT.G]|uniref:hypothetical protein n=1 Tax=Bartonella sp. ML70XJBT.G TaxID=3019093 RepID=UPI00235E38DE|nr:hypothetical protein [Bartonella sp. ML70XJBT.G]